MKGLYITMAYTLLLLFSVGCQTELPPRSSAPPLSAKSSSAADLLYEEGDTINLKMTAHATQLVFAAEDFKREDLSETHVREIKAWWDSLPQPLRSRVKSNSVAVEVVSNVVATPRTQALSQKSDHKIEQTGAALEKVIGSSTDMTYTVNTTVVEKVSTSSPSATTPPSTTNSDATATTNILLVETVAVKLSQFALDLPLQDMNEVGTETAQALQYWWTSLPEDLQNKIRQQEITIQLHVCSIDRGIIGKQSQKPILGLNADTKLAIVEDILHRIIGTYRAGTRTLALAKISATAPSIEKLGSHNAHIRSDQYLRLQLRSNRSSTTAAPSAM